MTVGYEANSASSAATDRTRSPAAGEPVMYPAGPALPDEETTTVPAAAALSAATVVGSSARPKSVPSERLMTFAPSLTARSIAAAITSVDPTQPKTR